MFSFEKMLSDCVCRCLRGQNLQPLHLWMSSGSSLLYHISALLQGSCQESLWYLGGWSLAPLSCHLVSGVTGWSGAWSGSVWVVNHCRINRIKSFFEHPFGTVWVDKCCCVVTLWDGNNVFLWSNCKSSNLLISSLRADPKPRRSPRCSWRTTFGIWEDLIPPTCCATKLWCWNIPEQRRKSSRRKAKEAGE